MTDSALLSLAAAYAEHPELTPPKELPLTNDVDPAYAAASQIIARVQSPSSNATCFSQAATVFLSLHRMR